MIRPKVFSLFIQSVRIDINKNRDDFTIGGDVILGESSILQDVQPGALLPFFRKVEKPMSTPPSFFRKVRIDLRLRESDKIWIDNNIAHMRLHSELGFIGTLAQPNISGRLSVEEGYILYLDRKFQVQQGVLDFIDPHRINPIVDFKAQADIKSYQTWSMQPYAVSLSIQGPLDHAMMDLTSAPPLDRPDIVTLLTIGATRKQMLVKENGGKASIGNVVEDRVGHLSSRQVSGFASRKIGNLLNLEDISIEGNLFRFGKSWGPQLLASKRITDRMEISYTTRVGHANEQSIRLDYRLLRMLSLEGQTDQQGRSGIDLKFRWKFK
jgi:autotransporter translocation and assembly factor TamB